MRRCVSNVPGIQKIQYPAPKDRGRENATGYLLEHRGSWVQSSILIKSYIAAHFVKLGGMMLLARRGLVPTLIIALIGSTLSNAAGQEHGAAAASCRVAVCLSGHIRSFVHSAMHKSIRRNLIEAIEADGCDVDVFAYATARDTVASVKQARSKCARAFEVGSRAVTAVQLQHSSCTAGIDVDFLFKKGDVSKSFLFQPCNTSSSCTARTYIPTSSTSTFYARNLTIELLYSSTRWRTPSNASYY